MKTKTLLVSIVALLAVFLVGAVSAAEVTNNMVVSFKDVQLNNFNNTVGYVGETVPVRVTFTSAVDAKDARIRVWISGHRDDVASTTRRLTLLRGNVYTELLNLRLPASLDLTDQDYLLHVEVSESVNYTRETFPIVMQRESYELKLLSVDYNLDVAAGSTIPVMVVVKNTGFQRNDDVYVIVAVPELKISARAYLEDLVAVEDCDEGCDDKDSVSKILNLKIPENANVGIYDMTVTVYNSDSRTVEKRVLKVSVPATSNLVATTRNQDIKAGETKTYDLVIVNSDNSIKVYTLSAVSSSALEVSVPSMVTVAPQSAYIVPVTIKAKSGADLGSYTFTVSVNGQQTSFVANVVKGSTSNGVVALTIILAVIFVALLVLLVVLLFKREKKVEEVENSYY
ncbi:MAG: hypothetical protein DDT42_01626 [candidate division WS2 bacterium]|uniref:Alpha-galactosidase NEW3 domain-containing protein n=1 Tax=Psychracetigena formicireducens TaxID=2986056 RepID=A0A9E2BML1_PSYF1|nr:hypothetical protein [Candidatus Psychracetigena formicireducens]